MDHRIVIDHRRCLLGEAQPAMDLPRHSPSGGHLGAENIVVPIDYDVGLGCDFLTRRPQRQPSSF
ncbi:MAG TPA: hypothetical protein DDZ51_01865 [Planctomycetaceae bacterium]|nr:hypothetical protein [Planctomycetaceae bacterium]